MSVEQMGIVWKLRLPHNQAWVLMALADHAHADGTECFPGVRLVAWQTGYGERQVRRILYDLRSDGIIEAVAYAAGGTRPTKYVLHLDRGVRKEPRSDGADPPVKKSAAPGAAVRPPDTAKSDEPSVTIIEPSGEPSVEYAWMVTLREIDEWAAKGEPKMDALIAWTEGKGFNRGHLEASAIGLASVSDKTLKGYRDLTAAYRRRLNQGYDDPTRQDGITQRGAGAVPHEPPGQTGGTRSPWDNRG